MAKGEIDDLGELLLQGMREAVAHAQGRGEGAVVHVVEVEVPEVRAIREALGLTQVAFAERFGFSVRAVQSWERGVRRPERAARTLLRLIQRSPDSVAEAAREVALGA